VLITAPADGQSVAGATFVVEGTASDSTGLATVVVQVAANSPVLARSTDGYRTWRAELPVAAGAFEVRAWGYDVEGLRSGGEDSVLLQGPPLGADDAPPAHRGE
jgi:hypothetical protein